MKRIYFIFLVFFILSCNNDKNLIHTYVKVPIKVSAVIFDGSVECVDAIISLNSTNTKVVSFNSSEIILRGLHGDLVGSKNDFIVKGISGELYPVKPDIFSNTYSPFDNNSSIINKFVRNTVNVRAVLFDGSKKSISAIKKLNSTNTFIESYNENELIIKTLEGNSKATNGDYIVQGINTELWPVKADIFNQTYEIVE